MKKIILFISLLLTISCHKKGTPPPPTTLQGKGNGKIENVSVKNTKETNHQIVDRPNKSKIINSKFDLKLLFGIWTLDPAGPHADFSLTEKSFYVVDYDGDGDMPYILNHDTIRVFYNDYCSIGIIKKVTKDSLKINWDENGIINYVKWKE
jgi:hypothetical protein